MSLAEWQLHVQVCDLYQHLGNLEFEQARGRILQSSKKALGFISGRFPRLILSTGCECTSKEHQGICEGPAFRGVVLHGSIAVPQAPTSHANALGNLFDARFIDEIFEAQLIGILKFKLVVVCQKSQKKERIKNLR